MITSPKTIEKLKSNAVSSNETVIQPNLIQFSIKFYYNEEDSNIYRYIR